MREEEARKLPEENCGEPAFPSPHSKTSSALLEMLNLTARASELRTPLAAVVKRPETSEVFIFFNPQNSGPVLQNAGSCGLQGTALEDRPRDVEL